MSRQLTWKHLSVEQVEEYLSLVDAPSRLAFLRAVSDLPDDAELAAITLDLYQYAMQFAQRRGFTADKVSALYSLAKETHESSMNNFWPARRSFEHFKELLLMHSVQRPPYSVGLYTLSDARAITDFFSAGYFRHYMLYKYAFTKKTEMRFATYYTRTVAVPEPFMLPMGEAEEEEKFLARQEQEKLDQLGTGSATFHISMEAHGCATVAQKFSRRAIFSLPPPPTLHVLDTSYLIPPSPPILVFSIPFLTQAPPVFLEYLLAHGHLLLHGHAALKTVSRSLPHEMGPAGSSH